MGRITLDDVQWLHQFYTACEVTLRQSYRDNPRATVWCAAARDFYKAIYQHAEREYQAQRARDRRRH